MSKTIPLIEDLNLWPHQVDAVNSVTKYIKSYKRSKAKNSALVQMPTGSGKSGVIAVLARCTKEVGLTIVLTPRKSLCKQLYNDINGRFFNHVGYDSTNMQKDVHLIKKGADLKLDNPPKEQVFVLTIQMLMTLEKTGSEVFKRIVSETSLIIVDEGHYEPAFEWSRVIRAIKTPKVVFTATPYRNDFKVFDIDPVHSYIYTLNQATEDRYLRSVVIVPRSKIGLPGPFVEDIIAFYDMTFPDPGDNPPRVIIRCDDSASIRQLALELQTRNRTVAGIHETFRISGGETWERKHVPNPDNEKAVFWIHQFKLMEGIDDQRFQILALYQKIRSARSLVQQVGRIIRNPSRAKEAKGYLLDHWNGHHEELWQSFIEYDTVIDEEGPKAFNLSKGEGILHGFIEQQPRVGYFEGRFRRKFDFEDVDPRKDIQVPFRTNLIQKTSDFGLEETGNLLKSWYLENDCQVRIYDIGADTKVILSIRLTNSPYLRNHSFLEAGLQVSILREYPEHVSLYDSSGQSLTGIVQAGLGGSIDVDKLKRLFDMGKAGKLTTVSLNNSNLGTSSIRSRTITASSIASTIPYFDDYAQICTTAEGYSQDEAGSTDGPGIARRYVGFSRGRVAQSTSGYVALPDYLRWLDQLGKILESKTSFLPVLSRYALKADPPIDEKAKPRNILLDLGDVSEIYMLRKDNEQLLEIEDTCSEVIGGEFKLTANGVSAEAKVTFIDATGRYQITSASLDSRYVKKEGESVPSSLVSYLNRSQSFRILPEDLTKVYIRGQFYKPAMKFGDDFDATQYPLGNCFVENDDIGRCGSEKGKEQYYLNHSEDWDPTSLFGIISRLGVGTGVHGEFGVLGEQDVLICDDVGTEIADFILCNCNNDNPRVIFIHAKAKALSGNRKPKCSASGLHDVCAQAVKNLGYMAMFNDHKPSKLESWDNGWSGKISKTYTAQVDHRICHGSGTPSELWEKFRATINNPMVDKQVWLFTGNLLSRKHFEIELKKGAPKPHILQAAYLLHATMSDVASVGAKLKVFCAK
ncbi:MAG: DEAD/DEAH box helicase family protein [Candidatus Marinimicrobia bacterium]|nr:DEAD/DEAH box helicase family protein [Candidatus Neomarinimicrobiota bacterium]